MAEPAANNSGATGFVAGFNRTVRPQGHVFFGWWIVLAAGGIQMLAGMLWMQSIGAYFVLLEEEFGWSKAMLAGAFALTRVESGLLGPLQGWLVDRYGPKKILLIGNALFGIGLIAFAAVDTIFTFYAVFVVIALGSSLGGFTTVIVSLVNWFDRHRAKALGISQVGYAVGGLCVPIVVFSLEILGWRVTAFISGVLVLCVGLPLSGVVRHRPETHGEVPDGTAQAPDEDGEPVAVSVDRSRDFTAREALRTKAFWLISIGHACALLAVSAIMVHLIGHLTTFLDYSLAQAGAMVAVLTAFQLIGQVGGGFLGDRFDKRMLCVLCMVGHTVGLLLLAHSDSTWTVLPAVFLHGIAWGTRGPLMAALRADYFGATSFGTIMGFSSLIIMIGMSGGPLVAAFFADLDGGSFERGFTYLAYGCIVGLLCFAFARPPKPPTRRQTTSGEN